MAAAPAETQTLVCPVTASQSQSECPVPPGLREQPRPAACSVKKGVAGTAEAGLPHTRPPGRPRGAERGLPPSPGQATPSGVCGPRGGTRLWRSPQGRVCPASSGTAARTADPESEAQRRRRARRSAVRPRGAGGRPARSLGHEPGPRGPRPRSGPHPRAFRPRVNTAYDLSMTVMSSTFICVLKFPLCVLSPVSSETCICMGHLLFFNVTCIHCLYICLLLPLTCFVSKYRCRFNPAPSSRGSKTVSPLGGKLSPRREPGHGVLRSPPGGLSLLQLPLTAPE